jgi:ATP-binding cassette subfamily B protein
MKLLIEIFRFLRHYTRPYRWVYLFGLLCLLLTNYVVVRIPQLVGEALDLLAKAGADAVAQAHHLAIEIFALGVALAGIRTLSRVLFFNPGRDIEYQLTVEIFEHLLRLPRAFFMRHKVGELVSLATSDTQAVRLLVGFAGLQLCNVAFALPLHVFKMWQTDPVLTLWCMGPIAIGAVYLQLTVSRFYGHVREVQVKTAKLSERVLESFAGVATVRAHAAQEACVHRFAQINREFLDHQLTIAKIRSFSLPALTYVGYISIGLVIYVGGQRVIEGSLPVGHLATFTSLLATLIVVLTSLVWVVVTLSRGVVSWTRLQEVFAQPSADAGDGRDIEVHAAPKIEVRDLSFGFDSQQAVLHDLSFVVKPGKMLGIFGKTGAGKTTILQLIARCFEPPAGTIHVDNLDVRSLSLASLRATMAFVPQDPFLFSASVRENIAMSADELDAKQREYLGEVVDNACLKPDLAVLPQGLETMVGERGVMLSGGQRQRTAFARALFRQPRILLLDDVLSAVDQSTEARMVDAIYRSRRRQSSAETPTTIVVSHRTSVLENADEIIVLDHGRIVERGTHAQLIAQNGEYAQAHRHQRASSASPANTKGECVPV